jgi:hypothetical protein
VGQVSQVGQVGGQIDSDGEDEDEDEEWQWLVARAKANERSSPVPPRPRAIATLGPVSSLAQRLEKIAAAAAAARNGQGQVDQTSERASGSA